MFIINRMGEPGQTIKWPNLMIFKLPSMCHTPEAHASARGSPQGNGEVQLRAVSKFCFRPWALIENTAKVVWKPLIFSNLPILNRR